MTTDMRADSSKHTNSDYKNIDKAIQVYAKKLNKTSQSMVMEEQLTYGNFFEDKMLIIQSIRFGFPYKLFNFIKEITPFTDEDWAKYLNLSLKSLQRYRAEEQHLFKPIHTEKIIELAEVTHYGVRVFDSNAQFYAWLNTPSFALGNQKPAELLHDSYGKELVMAELSRIEYGIFS